MRKWEGGGQLRGEEEGGLEREVEILREKR